jgi:hypothetical protein
VQDALTGCNRDFSAGMLFIGGNDSNWIIDAIEQALARFSNSGLKIHIVSYGRRNPALARLLAS